MEKTNVNLTSLQKRVLTSLIMIPLVIGALRFGHPYVDILVYLVGIMLAWEWSVMIPNQKANLYAVCYAFALGCSLIVFNNRYVLFFALAIISVFVYLKAKNEKYRCLLTLGVPYISIGVGALFWMYFLFAPKISPNKTWSGLIGGVILAIAVSFIYLYIIKNIYGLALPMKKQMWFAQLGAVIAFIAQIGDLVESAIKRYLQIKDSSSIIPGHGGVFDRIDGLIFAAPITYFLFCTCLI